MTMLDGCAEGKGFRFLLPASRTMTYLARATLDLSAPDDPAREAIAIERVRTWISTRFQSLGPVFDVQFYARTDSSVVRVPKTYGDGDLEPPIDIAPPKRTRGVELTLTCRASDRPTRTERDASPGCYQDEAVPLEVRGIEVTLREDVPPAGSAVGGTMFTNAPVSGVRGIDYAASDQESGLARIEAVIGESVIAAKDLVDRCAYADFTACPSTDRDTLAIDTRNIANGRHALTLRTVDAAGNRHDEPAAVIDISNGGIPLPVSEIGLGGAVAQLTAGFAGSSRSTLVVPFGRRVIIRGRLTGASKLGIPKARVDVLERVARSGAGEIAMGKAQTRADGTFSYVLGRTRPSRTVRLAHGPAASRALTVRVRASSSLKVSLRGTTVRFSGRVLSLPLPTRGKRVTLQGRAPGFAWAEFAKVRTDRRGRFSGTYRLPIRRPGVKLQIRVRVPMERDYPYLGYTGRPVTLRVR